MLRNIFLLIISLVFFSQLNAQSWEREYGIQNRMEHIFASSESYDGGFVLGLRVEDSKICLLKTDINGEVLWSKYIISTKNIYLESIDCSPTGQIVLTGGFLESSEDGDPFLIQLDACGNQSWCKVAQMEDGNYGRRILFSSDGNIIWHTYGDEDNYNLNHLWKIDNNGIALWKRNVASRYKYPFIHSPLFENFHETQDHGYVFAGSCYYPKDTNNPTGNYILRSFVVKTDSLGYEEWILPAGYAENISGHVDDVVEFKQDFYAVGYRYDTSLMFTSPLFLKISEQGNLLYHTVINQGDTLENYLRGISYINDSSLIITSLTRRNDIDTLKMGVFKTDTLGNIITWFENLNGSPINQCLVKTRDNKFLITGYTVHSGDYDGYAIKVNEDLAYDSLYTFPFNYDSLCPDAIVSDTLQCDCDILVIQEEQKVKTEHESIKISPNPTRDNFLLQLPFATNSKSLVYIYDLYGRKQKEIQIPAGQSEIKVNTTGWPRGLYLLRLQSEGKNLGGVKVVLE
jgi:Secretion system C-terminal sorting domain